MSRKCWELIIYSTCTIAKLCVYFVAVQDTVTTNEQPKTGTAAKEKWMLVMVYACVCAALGYWYKIMFVFVCGIVDCRTFHAHSCDPILFVTMQCA